MSGHADVRRAVTTYLQSPPIPGVVSVFRAVPVVIQGDSWAPALDTGWGAAIAVHLGEKRESRIALGGATSGIKRVDYAVSLVLIFRWVIPDDASEGPDTEPDGWADAFDALLDAVEARIRSDRTFGTGQQGVIWQAGEAEEDLRIQMDLPKVDNGEVQVWAAMEIVVTEMVEA